MVRLEISPYIIHIDAGAKAVYEEGLYKAAMIHIKDLIVGDLLMVIEDQADLPLLLMEELEVVYTGLHPMTDEYIVEVQPTEGISIRVELNKPSYTFLTKL